MPRGAGTPAGSGSCRPRRLRVASIVSAARCFAGGDRRRAARGRCPARSRSVVTPPTYFADVLRRSRSLRQAARRSCAAGPRSSRRRLSCIVLGARPTARARASRRFFGVGERIAAQVERGSRPDRAADDDRVLVGRERELRLGRARGDLRELRRLAARAAISLVARTRSPSSRTARACSSTYSPCGSPASAMLNGL